MVMFILNKLFGIFGKDNSLKKYLKENKIYHYSVKCDLVEYNFKDIYKTFNISYFSKNIHSCKQFADSKYLKDYESIEKLNDNVNIVLIQKFKLRLSFMKNSNFSKNIMICDDYNFDFTKLSHKNSLIKIALIKNNIDNWLNSNLNEYDYIFTLNEYFKEFNGSKHCFMVEGETVYEYIKNIFNILYKRKSEKFYQFVKNVDFQDVFPKRRNYFTVLDSEYFDDSWYRETYNLSNNTDSIVHFLLVGADKGYNPSPDFNIHEYYECNKDVKVNGINALIHYELYGRKENRIIHTSEIPKRDYLTILNSNFFDGDWYARTYSVEGDCADHYLNIGFTKGYHPGPDFNHLGYYEANRDVMDVRMNPLLHYELYGRNEKRLLISEKRYDEFYSAVLNSPYFDEEWYKNTYKIKDDAVYHYLNIGFALDYNPGPDFSTREYYDCNPDVEEYGMNPLAHYEMYGRDENRTLHVSDMKDGN